jgi:hypothetical protein
VGRADAAVAEMWGLWEGVHPATAGGVGPRQRVSVGAQAAILGH